MLLECKIKNINNINFNRIFIKKLRQVIFLSNERNTIYVYSALLVGANNAEKVSNISDLTEEFRLEVAFDAVNDGTDVQSITSENKIDDFFEEMDTIREIWGKGCHKITTQDEVHEYLQEVLQTDSAEVDSGKTKVGQRRYLYTESLEGKNDISIACEGEVELRRSNGYAINGQRDMHEGMDCITWVKTTIKLTGKLSRNERIVYKLNLPIDKEERVILSYLSIYICPPDGYHILDDSKVKFILKGGKENEDENNNLTAVTQNTAVYYREWIKEHHIENLIIYRLNKEKLFGSLGNLQNCEYVNVSFMISPNTEKGSMQFVLGAVFSALVSFGIDNGRLCQIRECFLPFVPPDLQWLGMVLLVFLSFLRWCSKREKIVLGVRDRVTNFFYRAGNIILGIWCTYTFFLLRIDHLAFCTGIREFTLGKIPYFAWSVFGSGIFCMSMYMLLTFVLVRNHYSRKPFSKDIIF